MRHMKSLSGAAETPCAITACPCSRLDTQIVSWIAAALAVIGENSNVEKPLIRASMIVVVLAGATASVTGNVAFSLPARQPLATSVAFRAHVAVANSPCIGPSGTGE